ncbi:hypothetical protein H8356DRAFT_1697629 [Neocallimastix lanati (nom. inval.)]|jgi:tetratricopeptide (TPR) repeat protein|uniref:Uncharacterized protein n=1 Tax=Neocallimastix californiae TaxID=1754190 RepID=A0A1Y2AVM6_9FUNG|nr:hypothetical protein H8356DRAFT_1697629 [Neocallimastix sp. JGI-2020a]ORY26628.1 hypothetical protein LY90DRAFT_388588 [Neocallimastix californiae]|eukprot:ORY26628.1 hypothetical protein LY90DRAFT_388588 [Neocallimastix californiae]
MSDTEEIKEINIENVETEDQEAITEVNKTKNTENDDSDGKQTKKNTHKLTSKPSNKSLNRDSNVSNTNKSKVYPDSNIQTNAEEWLLMRVGLTPKNSIGWFRCGVGFYNKKEYTRSIECFEKSIEYDPLNYNAFQIMARACIAVNRKDDAIKALKQSVMLDNPSDWQLLVELTSITDD